MRFFVRPGLLTLAALFAVSASAQVTEPPPIIQLVRMPGADANLKPYTGAALEVIGMTAITGVPETWLLEAHQSFASIEELDQRLDSQHVMPANDTQTLIAICRDDWSYRAADASRLFARARYFRISVQQIKSGAEGDFGQLIQLRRQTEESMGLDRPEIAYQVVSGAPVGTYLFVAPVVSLRKFDDARPGVPVYAESLAEIRARAKAKIAPDAEVSHDNYLLRVEPQRSYVSDAFAEQDPIFWRGKGAQ